MDLEKLEEQATNGEPEAQYQLAETLYNKGELSQAIDWYTKAAKQNCSEAQYWLAVYYCNNENSEKAKCWAEKAIGNGHAIGNQCLNKLGLFHPDKRPEE